MVSFHTTRLICSTKIVPTRDRLQASRTKWNANFKVSASVTLLAESLQFVALRSPCRLYCKPFAHHSWTDFTLLHKTKYTRWSRPCTSRGGLYAAQRYSSTYSWRRLSCLTLIKESWYSLNRRLCGIQSWYGWIGEGKRWNVTSVCLN